MHGRFLVWLSSFTDSFATITISKHIGMKNNVYYTKAELTKSNYRFVKLSCIYQYIFIKTDE